jgi:hypothetical protein
MTTKKLAQQTLAADPCTPAITGKIPSNERGVSLANGFAAVWKCMYAIIQEYNQHSNYVKKAGKSLCASGKIKDILTRVRILVEKYNKYERYMAMIQTEMRKYQYPIFAEKGIGFEEKGYGYGKQGIPYEFVYTLEAFLKQLGAMCAPPQQAVKPGVAASAQPTATRLAQIIETLYSQGHKDEAWKIYAQAMKIEEAGRQPFDITGEEAYEDDARSHEMRDKSREQPRRFHKKHKQHEPWYSMDHDETRRKNQEVVEDNQAKEIEEAWKALHEHGDDETLGCSGCGK